MKPLAAVRFLLPFMLAALSGCASLAPPLPAAPVHANGGVLWKIVHDRCVPGQREHGDPAPCAVVSIKGGEKTGFVLLKDRVGVGQYLLMPTDKVSGIEDPAIFDPAAPRYFAEAWKARTLVEAKLGRHIPRESLSIAVNSLYGRSQDLLHLHIDCLDGAVRDALQAEAGQIHRRWSRQSFVLKGHAYRIMRLDGEDLGTADPFRILAEGLPGARRNMGAWTLVLAGAASPQGRPGFYLIAARADPARGEMASGEDLQDHACHL